MEADFWHSRWQEGRIGFHQAEYNRYLQDFASTMPRPKGGRVLVPLSGKTKDLTYLRDMGHDVVAVEIVETAGAAYFHEAAIPFSRRVDGGYPVLEGGGVQVHVADFFEVQPQVVGPIDWVFDRAALVALPPAMRARYVPHLMSFLAPGAESLLLTFAYEQAQMSGPPFSVPDEEVQQRFAAFGRVDRLVHEDILEASPRFKKAGLTALTESVWRITRQ